MSLRRWTCVIILLVDSCRVGADSQTRIPNPIIYLPHSVFIVVYDQFTRAHSRGLTCADARIRLHIVAWFAHTPHTPYSIKPYSIKPRPLSSVLDTIPYKISTPQKNYYPPKCARSLYSRQQHRRSQEDNLTALAAERYVRAPAV